MSDLHCSNEKNNISIVYVFIGNIEVEGLRDEEDRAQMTETENVSRLKQDCSVA